MAPFKYKPLERTGNHGSIRLLKLQPGTMQDRIRVSLVHVRQEDFPIYEALSYCWGDPEPVETIICNGAPHYITKNLFKALLRLRHRHDERTLWIDAISIDQSNVDERNYQVQLMQSIYRHAASVVVWLDDSDDDPQTTGFSLITRLKSASEPAPTSFQDEVLKFWGLDFAISLDNRNEDSMPQLLDQRYEGFRRLVQKSWFGRVWVIQEAAVAQMVKVQYKDDTVDWKVLVEAIDACSYTKMEHIYWDFDLEAASKASSINSMRQLFQSRQTTRNSNEKKTSLLRLLYMSGNFEATDGRDKVFALLGLASDSNQLGILPNYHLTQTQVFKDTTIAIIQGKTNLDVLALIPIFPHTTKNPLPSWAPNWNFKPKTSMYEPFALRDFMEPKFAVSRGSRHEAKFAGQDSILVVQSQFFDSIKEIGREYLENIGFPVPDWIMFLFLDPENINFIEAVIVVAEWERLALTSSTTEYPTSSSRTDAFWETLACGFYKDDPQEMRVRYAQWTKAARVVYLCSRLRPAGFGLLAGLLLCLVCLVWKFFQSNIDAIVRFQRMPLDGLRFAVTFNGYFCLVPYSAQIGDEIHLVKGSATPLILRPIRNGKLRFQAVGDCYVQGIMSGEAFVEQDCRPINVI